MHPGHFRRVMVYGTARRRGTYTVDCTATYADGSVWDGIADVETSKGDIGFEPVTMVSAGDSGD